MQRGNKHTGKPWVRKALLAYFILITLAAIWPLYPLASRVEPFVLGIPFSLAYLIFLLTLSFIALLADYLWGGQEED